LSVQLGAAGTAPRTYAASVTAVPSDPARYGRPATASAAAPGFRLGALLDHVRATPRDTAMASLAGVALPPFSLPSLPIRLEPGSGTVALSLAVQGDEVRARWTMQSDRVRWSRDSSGAASPSPTGDLVWRVVSGIPTLAVSASLTGSLARPQLAVSSNLDRALAERLRAVAGAELAVAERLVRAQVDSLVDGQVAAVLATVTVPRGAAIAGNPAGRGFRGFGTVGRAEDGVALARDGVTPVRMDVTDTASITRARGGVERALGATPLIALVNNAGIPAAGPLELFPLD